MIEQNHEFHVSLETAKLTKEAGFDWQTDHFYRGDVLVNHGIYDHTISFHYPAPTQSSLQRWLREVKKIIVLVDYDEDVACPEDERYGATVYISNERDVILDTYSTYEEALEAGLQKTLKQVIKKSNNHETAKLKFHKY